MRPFFGRSSLSSDFTFFALIIFAAIVALSLGFWVEIYRTELAKKRDQLPLQATRIDSVLTDSFDYSAKYAEFIGQRIVQHDVHDLNYISNIIRDQYADKPQAESLYITTMFDWVTPDKQLRVSTKAGILPKPLDMSDRDYLAKTQLSPWTLQLGAPRFGGLSKQWIVPAGMGFTDKNGTFVGSLTLGFAIEGLTRRLAASMDSADIHYLVLTTDRQLVLDSKTDNVAPIADFTLDAQAQVALSQTGSHFLAKPFTYHNVNFTYLKKVNKYPYIILTGYNTGMAQSLFNEIVLSRFLGFAGIGAAAFVMLYMMRRRLIKPVMQLAAAADKISHGQKVSLANHDFHEIAILGQQLQKISDYVQNERRISEELTQKTWLLECHKKELETANAEARAACEAALKADRAKSEFLANMSHELRTPLNAVIGLTDILLRKSYAPEKQREYLRVMQMSAQHLMQLINDLLDITRLESGQVTLEKIPFSLEEIIGKVISINEVTARQKGIELIFKKHFTPPALLVGDEFRLRQVLINLVGNAIKFTEKGSVTVELDGRQNLETGLFDLRLAIVDTGIGIPEDKLDTIFNKFSQADNSISRTHGGSGLGLSISRIIINLMKGKISVQSTYGQGARFTIELSLPAPHETIDMLAITQHIQTPLQKEMAPKNSHILLVEDNPANILVATLLLESYGYSFDLAKNGKQALLKLQNQNFDIVLTDVEMPEMNGFEVTRAIREREKELGLPPLPVIGMTAHALSEDKFRCIQSGMDDYISKPFLPEEFIKLLSRFAKAKDEKLQPTA